MSASIPALMPVYPRCDVRPVRGEGVYLYGEDGTQYLDFAAGIAVNALGHGHPVLTKAIADQAATLMHVSNLYGSPQGEAFAQKLVDASFADTLFFTNSGTEAVECAIKTARRYHFANGNPERHTLITFNNAFHGRTMGAISATNQAKMRDGFEPLLPGFAYAPFNDLDAALALVDDHTAGFMVETIQGEGGVSAATPEFIQGLRRAADEHGLLLVLDEVQCGYGRTGKMWGHETMGFTPDLMPMAKGLSSGYLPISATAVAAHVVEVLKTGGDFVHGFTYSGHPVAAAVALKNIEIIEREGLVERTGSVTGPHLAKALATLNDHPLVGEARSIGLLGAVEIVADKATRARFGGAEGTAGPMARDACIANGLMVRGIRDSLVMCPPLIISTDQIDEMVAIIRKSLDEVLPKLRALS